MKRMKIIDRIKAMLRLIEQIGETVTSIVGKCVNGRFRVKYHLASGAIIPRTYKMNK